VLSNPLAAGGITYANIDLRLAFFACLWQKINTNQPPLHSLGIHQRYRTYAATDIQLPARH